MTMTMTEILTPRIGYARVEVSQSCEEIDMVYIEQVTQEKINRADLDGDLELQNDDITAHPLKQNTHSALLKRVENVQQNLTPSPCTTKLFSQFSTLDSKWSSDCRTRLVPVRNVIPPFSPPAINNHVIPVHCSKNKRSRAQREPKPVRVSEMKIRKEKINPNIPPILEICFIGSPSLNKSYSFPATANFSLPVCILNQPMSISDRSHSRLSHTSYSSVFERLHNHSTISAAGSRRSKYDSMCKKGNIVTQKKKENVRNRKLLPQSHDTERYISSCDDSTASSLTFSIYGWEKGPNVFQRLYANRIPRSVRRQLTYENQVKVAS